MNLSKVDGVLPFKCEEDGGRASMIRRYDSDSSYREPNAYAWVSATPTAQSSLLFQPLIMEKQTIGAPLLEVVNRCRLHCPISGQNARQAGVVLKWTTESELDNAGFYIHRSETKNGDLQGSQSHAHSRRRHNQ